jgi:MtaA/CmuA family methyltransferase
MPKVTPFNRVMTTIRGQLPDRVPVIPQITYATAQLTGLGLVEALHSPPKTAAALLAGQRELGYDAVYVGWESSFNLLAEAMGCTMRFPDNDLPQVTEHVVRSPNDLDKVKIPDPHSAARLPIRMETVKLVKQKTQGRVPLFGYVPGPFTLAGQLCGVTQLMIATLRNPQFVHDLTQLATTASVAYARAIVEAGIDVTVAADPSASTSLISPQMFATFAAPALRTVLHAAETAGAVPSLHICGQTTPILEAMCSTGAHVLEVDHLVDLSKAKQLVGQRVTLLGNINPTDTLLKGSPKTVTEAAKSCIHQAAAGGRFILSSGCDVPTATPLANIRAMVAAAQQYGRYH